MLTRCSQTEGIKSAALRNADEQAHRWSAALKAKKAAMESMLRAQQSLEEVESSIATFLPKETIEGTHAQFLSTLPPSDPEGLYLLALGRRFIRPLSSRIKSSRHVVTHSHAVNVAVVNSQG